LNIKRVAKPKEYNFNIIHQFYSKYITIESMAIEIISSYQLLMLY